MPHKKRVFIALFCLLFLFPENAFPFKMPETLKYDLIWAGVRAGEAALEIKEEGDEIKITSTAESAKWVSIFYTVRDRVESRVSKNHSGQVIWQPVNYRLNLREGRHRKNKEVRFDSIKSKAVYIDYIDNEEKEFETPVFILDPLSSFYYLRNIDLEVGRSVYVAVFDNKKIWNVEVRVLRRERIKVPAGEFETIVIKPLMKSEGIFFRRGDIYIWLTDDEKRIPVRMKTKVKIGSITANLVGGSY